MTPVEQRTGRCWIRLQREPLQPAEVIAFVVDEAAGAVASFIGTTRRWTGGRETVTLSYEAYDEMAVAEMVRLAEEALRQEGVGRVAIHHRTGDVGVGEASVTIAVSGGHRGEAFLACRELIDRLKQEVPIWKRETYADGTREWVRSSE